MKKILLFAVMIFVCVSMAMASVGTNPNGNLKIKSSPSMNIAGPSGGLHPLVTEHGRISWSVDGLGENTGSGMIRVQKPAGATVRAAYMAAASTGFSGYHITNSDITILGSPISWGLEVPSSISSFNYWQDVTSLVKPTIDGASPGIIDLNVTEANTFSIDGESLIVIFDDPNQLHDNTVILAFGAQNIAGDTFNIGLSDPINKSLPGFMLDMSLGISFSFQDNGVQQYSIVNINSNRLTTSAGGEDDGQPENGALLTTGGIGDSNANPADPTATPTNPRSDDELYNLIPFVNNGDTSINAFTQNPSSDDNIYFAGFFLGSTTALSGGGILLSPVNANNPIHTQHTLTATVRDVTGAPIVNTTVHFDIISGPNTGLTGDMLTDANGKANFTYTGNSVGTDIIQASFFDNLQNLITSNNATKVWEDIRQCSSDITLVSGTITNQSGPVANTSVDVTCTHNNVDHIESATTLSDGSYAVVFPNTECAPGDTVTLHALDRTATGVVTNNCTCVTNLALVNIEIPEFGIIGAMLVALAGIGIVAYKRKK